VSILIVILVIAIIVLVVRPALARWQYQRLSPAMKAALREGQEQEKQLAEQERQGKQEREKQTQEKWDALKTAFPARLAKIVKEKRAGNSNCATFVAPAEEVHSEKYALPFMAATFEETMRIAAQIARNEGLRARIVTVPTHNRSWQELEIRW
jgi:Tfp pilus assembly protein PilE